MPIVSFGQKVDSMINLIMERVVDDEDNVNREDLYEELLHFSENPLNINTCQREDLEKLFFLSLSQIENLQYYLYSYGPIYSVYELQLVEGFDAETISFLLPFVFVGEMGEKKGQFVLQKELENGKHEILSRADVTFQQKEGYAPISKTELEENPDKRYLGSPLYSYLKYRFYSSNLSCGVSMEKDTGEPFDWNYNKGFDFYSAHVFVSNLWHFKHLIIGDYKLNFGQGLVFHSDNSYGKSNLLGLAFTKNEISKSASTNEYGFFRGFANTLQVSKLNITTFVSSKKVDATLSDLEGEETEISTIKSDGYHRIVSDFEKKGKVNELIFGVNVNYTFPFCKIGFSGERYSLSEFFLPEVKPYNLYGFNGKSHWNIGSDYRFRLYGFNFAGEVAIDRNNAFAQVHNVSFQPISRLGLSALYRNYSPKYYAPIGNAFGENGSVNNETGLFLGMNFLPVKRWKLNGYVDVFSFPWLKYLVNKPSQGYIGSVQADHTLSSRSSLFIRYKIESREKNETESSEPTSAVYSYSKQEIKVQFDAKISSNCSIKSGVNTNEVSVHNQKETCGLLLYQDFTYQITKMHVTLNMRYAFFDAQDYNNRLYAFETDVLYAYSVPMYYGQGSRYYLNVCYAPTKNLNFYLKLAETIYSNKDEIGTGLETIEGNKKTDMRLFVSWKF